ncbi:MAG: hypothetical protein QOI07_927 [Verrucomicrobiota bacterium]|jgi:hypothetical protein
MTKAEQEARDRHDAYEKQREKDGIEVHLPRSGEPGAPDYVPPASEKKKSGGK